MEKSASKNNVDSKLEKHLVKALTELISRHETSGVSYREDDITITNPKYLSQQEKNSIYHLWAFIKNRVYLTDKKLKELVENNPEEFDRYKIIVKNFPNLIENLRKNGLDETILLCAKQRRMVAQLREVIDKELSAVKKESPAKILNKKQYERIYLHALYIYIKKTNTNISDNEFARLVEGYTKQLGSYTHIIKEIPNLIELMNKEGYSYVVNNLSTLEDPFRKFQ